MKHSLIHFLTIISCLAGSPGTMAEDAETANTGSWDAANWATAKPGDITADWVQTTSGEWLTGEIILIHDYKLEFDSDEFDDIEIDIDDVQYIKSYWPQVLRFEGRRVAVGTIELTDDQIIITNAEGEQQTFPRDELVTMTSGGDTESSYWDISVALGANIRKGNTDEVSYNAKTHIKRQTVESRFMLDYLGNFTTVDNERTANNHRVNSNFDIFITKHFFWQPVFGEYFRDRFQNIDSRILIGTGVGYYLIKTSKTEWDISGGPAAQQTRFVTVQAGEEDKETTPSLSVVSFFDTAINSKVDLIHTYNISVVEQEAGGYTHHMIATLETELTSSFDLDVSLIWDHISKPTQRDDGTFPERNDTQLVLSIKYDY